jgi:hypothetical protein
LKADIDEGIVTTTGPYRLVLVTCAGAVFDHEYANLVVHAWPVTA